jgi:hypothetical protein
VRRYIQAARSCLLPQGQGLGNAIPFPSRASAQFEGTVCRRQRLGGVLSFYERKAA